MYSWHFVHSDSRTVLVRKQDTHTKFCSGLPRLKIILKHMLPCHVLQYLGKDQGTCVLGGWQTYKVMRGKIICFVYCCLQLPNGTAQEMELDFS